MRNLMSRIIRTEFERVELSVDGFYVPVLSGTYLIGSLMQLPIVDLANFLQIILLKDNGLNNANVICSLNFTEHYCEPRGSIRWARLYDAVIRLHLTSSIKFDNHYLLCSYNYRSKDRQVVQWKKVGF